MAWTYDDWKTTRPGEWDEELPQEQCSMCQCWVDAEDQHDDGDPIYPTCPSCDDVTCKDCKDDDTDECSACVQRAEERRQDACTVFATLSTMSRMVAQGGAP